MFRRLESRGLLVAANNDLSRSPVGGLDAG
jgi:hypothetical protein